MFIFFIISGYISSYALKKDVVQVSNINISDNFKKLDVAVNKDDYVVQKIEEKADHYNISIYYPLTKFEILNKEIQRVINGYLSDFKSSVNAELTKGIWNEFYLDIKFNMYKYKNYVSYVFYISNFTGGAHGNSYFYTITFDTSKKQIITISDLKYKNKSLLVDLSNYTYKNLMNNQELKDIGALDMIKDGTKPIKDNFKNFALTNEGIMIFFENYQVAPHVAGEFVVTVPYDKAELDI